MTKTMRWLDRFSLWGCVLRAPDDGQGGAPSSEGDGAAQPAAGAGDEGGAPAAPTSEEGAAAAPAPEAPRQRPWFERRIDTLTAQKNEREREAESLRQQLAMTQATLQKLSGAGPQEGEDQQAAPPPDAPKRPAQSVEELAEAMADAKLFNQRCNNVAAAGKGAHADFDVAIAQLQSAVELSRDFLEDVLESDIAAPQDLLYALGKNPEKAQEIASLPARARTRALDRFAESLKEPPKKQSKAPAPLGEGVGGGGSGRAAGTSTANTEMDIREWMALRDKEAQANRRR